MTVHGESDYVYMERQTISAGKDRAILYNIHGETNYVYMEKKQTIIHGETVYAQTRRKG